MQVSPSLAGSSQSVISKKKIKILTLKKGDLCIFFGSERGQNSPIPQDESVTTPDSSRGGGGKSEKETLSYPPKHISSPHRPYVLQTTSKWLVRCCWLGGVSGAAWTTAASLEQTVEQRVPSSGKIPATHSWKSLLVPCSAAHFLRPVKLLILNSNFLIFKAGRIEWKY